MQEVFINTLVFIKRESPPINQAFLIEELVKKGFRNVEIRREFMSDAKREVKEIGDVVKKNNVNLYYSIADTLFEDNKINVQKISKFIEEAQTMGSKTIKLSIGDYEEILKEDEIFLKQLLLKNIKILVENDQTILNGKVEKIIKFLEEAKQKKIDIKATFDVGNWLWNGEDPKANADVLQEYVEYVHFKDVAVENGKLVSVPLGEGIIDYKYYSKFFKGKPFGIEYPCGEDVISVIKEEVKKLV